MLYRHVSHVPQTRGWEKKIAEGPPCVVLASPGFMQVGPSRELFELWAPDSRNGLIITGYSIEGTLARVSDKWLRGLSTAIPVPCKYHATMDTVFIHCGSFVRVFVRYYFNQPLYSWSSIPQLIAPPLGYYDRT